VCLAEAHKIKLKADSLEAFELEKMRNQHQMRLSNVVEKFKTKQTAEILALRKRVQTVDPAPPPPAPVFRPRLIYILLHQILFAFSDLVGLRRAVKSRKSRDNWILRGCFNGTKTSNLSWNLSKTLSASVPKSSWAIT
jgi:hypothetical protein